MLVFDDETDILFLFRLILNKKGHEVFTSSNCEHLLETVSFVKPDIIFMDNSMPGVTGFEAIKRLKASAFSNIPVVLCSANSDAEQLAQIAKADMFLPKPFSVHDLEKSIRMLAA